MADNHIHEFFSDPRFKVHPDRLAVVKIQWNANNEFPVGTGLFYFVVHLSDPLGQNRTSFLYFAGMEVITT